MKKITLIFSFLAIFGFLFIFNVPTIKAQTASQLQALIQQLQAQISALQQQLTQVQGQPTTWCHTFNANMAIGSSGTEVLELKTALIKNGVWPYEDVTDKFDEETASYVVAFQQKYRSEILTPWKLTNGTGFVGASTRVKLNSLFGCTSATPTLNPAANSACIDSDGYKNFYTKGSAYGRFQDGYGNVIIKWWEDYCVGSSVYDFTCKTNVYSNSDPLDVFADSIYCPYGCQNGACLSGVKVISPNGGEQWAVGETKRISWQSSDVKYVRLYIYDSTISSSGSTNYIYNGVISAATGYYDWTIQQSQLPGSASLSRQYKIRIDGLNESAIGATVLASDYSDNYFSIVSSAPTCTDTDGGKNIYQKGTVTTVNGSNTDECYYNSVREYWCNSDNDQYGVVDIISCPYGCQNGACLSGVKVTSPNGGEQWTAGNTYNIRWSVSGVSGQIAIELEKWSSDRSTVQVSGLANVSATAGVYSWSIPSNQTASSYYKIKIYSLESKVAQATIVDESDNYFSIISSASSANKFIMVTYPTAGEQLRKGSNSLINLQFTPAVPKGGFVVNLVRSDADVVVAHLKFCGTAGYVQDVATPINVGWTWRVGYNVEGREIPNGSYRVFVYDCGDKTDPIWTGGNFIAKSGIFSIVAGSTGLEDVNNQLASMVEAFSDLIEQVKNFLGK